MSENAASFYTYSVDGDATVFHVTPGRHGLADGAPILLILGIAMLLLCFPIGLVLIGVHFYQARRTSSNSNSNSKGRSIVLGKWQPYFRETAIRVRPGSLSLPSDLASLYGRTELTSAEIHQFVVRNPIVEDLGYGRIYTSNNAAFNIGRDLRLSMAREVGWAVDVESGGRAFTLVLGLNETTANGLMHDLTKVIQSMPRPQGRPSPSPGPAPTAAPPSIPTPSVGSSTPSHPSSSASSSSSSSSVTSPSATGPTPATPRYLANLSGNPPSVGAPHALPPATTHPSPLASSPAPRWLSRPTTTLVRTDGALAGRKFVVDADLELGRAGSTIPMDDDPTVSPRHALVRVAPTGLSIHDLGSETGTFVNGVRVQEAELRFGDQVVVGRTSFRIE